MKTKTLNSKTVSTHEPQLEMAWRQAQADLAKGNYLRETAAEHVKRVTTPQPNKKFSSATY